MDLIDVDVPENALSPDVHSELRQQELANIVNENVRKQYQQFDNLGQNYLAMFDLELNELDKIDILSDMISYVNKHLISIVNLDDMNGDRERLLTAGSYIYEFICIDCYSSLIPALMEVLNITSVDDLDGLINLKYLGSPAKFKEDFLSTIQITIEQLKKLEAITPEIKKDKNYQRLLGKYFYYQEIVEYGDTTMFLQNFLRPVINKYSTDFIWKLL